MTAPKVNNVTIDGFTFNSNFESGNAASVEKVGLNEYMLSTSVDAYGTPYETSFRTWFYFSVAGGAKGESITLIVNNLNPQSKLYNQGYTPVVRTFPSSPHWTRSVPAGPITTKQSEGKVFQIKFTYMFPYENETTEFAFCYPFSYTELQQKLVGLDDRFKTSKSIYYHRDLLGLSLDGHRLDLITVSSFDGISKHETEASVEGIYPEPPPAPGTADGKVTQVQWDTKRSRKFPGKPVYFLSARVHPGESPASYVFNGFLDFILKEHDPRAQVLRKNYVFKFVPMLNPDGVARGHYRADPLGMNLNRIYKDPDPVRHPTIYAVKKDQLKYYVDLHGHATKRGCFMYGNALDTTRQVDNVLYAKLVSVNTPHFDFSACNFSEKNMRAKDKRDGLSKEGSGRVAIYKETNIVHSYTLECNYNMGKSVNRVAPAVGESSDRATPPRNSRVKPSGYSTADFEDVGKALAVAVLDMDQCNPWSRLEESDYINLDILRQWIAQYVRGEVKVFNKFRAQKLAKKEAGRDDRAAASAVGGGAGPSRLRRQSSVVDVAFGSRSMRLTTNTIKDRPSSASASTPTSKSRAAAARRGSNPSASNSTHDKGRLPSRAPVRSIGPTSNVQARRESRLDKERVQRELEVKIAKEAENRHHQKVALGSPIYTPGSNIRPPRRVIKHEAREEASLSSRFTDLEINSENYGHIRPQPRRSVARSPFMFDTARNPSRIQAPGATSRTLNR